MCDECVKKELLIVGLLETRDKLERAIDALDLLMRLQSLRIRQLSEQNTVYRKNLFSGFKTRDN